MSLIKCCFDPVELPEFIDTMIQKCTDPGCKYAISNWIFLRFVQHVVLIVGAEHKKKYYMHGSQAC